MKFPRLRNFWFLLILALTSPVVAGLPTADDYVRWPEILNATISKDGRFVAFLTPSGREYFHLNCTDLKTGKTERFDLQGSDVYQIEWIDEERLLVHTFHPELHFPQIAIFSTRQGKITGYLMHELVNMEVYSHLRRDPDLFIAGFRAGRQIDTGRTGVAIISAARRPSGIAGVKDNRYMVKEWLDIPAGEFKTVGTDVEGELRLVITYTDGKLIYHYRRGPDAPWIALPLDPEQTNIIDFDSDPDFIYVGHYAEGATASTLHRYQVSTGDFGKAIYSDNFYSMYDASIRSVRSGRGKMRPLALSYDRNVTVQLPLDPEFAAVQKEINAQLPGRLNVISDCDNNLERFVVYSTSGRDTPRYVIYTRKDKSMMALPEGRPWLDPAAASLMQPIKFKARDGLELEGYLSLPGPRKDGKKPPLVVNPHGGPWLRDTWSFNTEVQFLTSRGYAVFQPNYRGSAGYNRAISKAEAFDFRKMHDDVTDGVKQLIKQGIVDGDRVAIFGGSFGGYLAVAGAALEPGLYRCAITFAGVFDWEQMLKQHWTNAKYDQFNYDYLKRKLGDPKQQTERFDAMSPINHVAAIKCPVYVIHGKLDGTVNYKQSTRLLSELAANKVPHEKLFFDTEYHGFADREHYGEFLRAVEAFLAKHL